MTHPFFPLAVGSSWTLEGKDEDGEKVRLVISAKNETSLVAGVSTRVVEEREWVDGELAEVALNYFALARDGTLCYFGEQVDFYEDGKVVSHEGSWLAGKNGAQPGILLPAKPAPGQRFAQEAAPGLAEDEAEIVAVGEPVSFPAGNSTDTIRLREHNPLDGDVSAKIYARNLGLVVDDEFRRISP